MRQKKTEAKGEQSNSDQIKEEVCSVKAKIMLIVIMLCVCLCATGLSESVKITGDCNVRTGPGLDYDIIDVVSKGEELEYWNRTISDSRGVDWYNVIYGNVSAWVSSKYSVLDRVTDDISIAAEDALSTINGKTDVFELLGCPKEDIEWMLDVQSDDFNYENEYLFVMGQGSIVDEVNIYAENDLYCIQGVTYGMSVAEAEAQLRKLGWKSAGVYEEDYDIHQRFYTNQLGNEIDLYTYDYDDYQTVKGVIARITEHDW